MGHAERMKSPERPFEILYPAEQIQAEVAAMSKEIHHYYYGNGRSMPPIISLLEGARPFARDLNHYWQTNLGYDQPFPVNELHAHSYEGETSAGKLDVDMEALAGFGLEGAREVLLLDDVLDSGITLSAMGKLLKEEFGVKKVDIAVVVDKLRLSRPMPVRARFTGFVTDPNHWIFGYGMDDGSETPQGEEKRQLPYIARFTS